MVGELEGCVHPRVAWETGHHNCVIWFLRDILHRYTGLYRFQNLPPTLQTDRTYYRLTGHITAWQNIIQPDRTDYRLTGQIADGQDRLQTDRTYYSLTEQITDWQDRIVGAYYRQISQIKDFLDLMDLQASGKITYWQDRLKVAWQVTDCQKRL